MSEWRLDRQPASAFLAQFDPSKIKICRDDAELEIAVGRYQFHIGFPTHGSEVKPEHVDIAREILAQVGDLDKIAMREVDGTNEDGELFVVEIVSQNEVDFHYSALSWNSEWIEMFRRGDDGRWVHHGIRKFK